MKKPLHDPSDDPQLHNRKHYKELYSNRGSSKVYAIHPELFKGETFDRSLTRSHSSKDISPDIQILMASINHETKLN